MFRLPRGVLDPETTGQYCDTDTASLTVTDSHLILSLSIDQEEGAQVQALLLRRFRSASGSPAAAPARTAADLRRAAGDRKAARARAAEQHRREAESRRRAAQAAAYAKHLDQLATRTEAAWEKAAELIETRRPRDYDLAASLLRDLQALAERQEDSAAFRKRFGELRARHQRKPSLLDRFDQVGLPS